jgi:hypothetical protein
MMPMLTETHHQSQRSGPAPRQPLYAAVQGAGRRGGEDGRWILWLPPLVQELSSRCACDRLQTSVTPLHLSSDRYEVCKQVLE